MNNVAILQGEAASLLHAPNRARAKTFLRDVVAALQPEFERADAAHYRRYQQAIKRRAWDEATAITREPLFDVSQRGPVTSLMRAAASVLLRLWRFSPRESNRLSKLRAEDWEFFQLVVKVATVTA